MSAAEVFVVQRKCVQVELDGREVDGDAIRAVNVHVECEQSACLILRLYRLVNDGA